MKQLFKSQEKVRKEHVVNIVYENIAEKQFIMKFFKELPIDDLKRLINFQKIDPDDKNVWNDEKNHEYLNQLKYERCIVYKCELYLDNGVDDLSLGQIS